MASIEQEIGALREDVARAAREAASAEHQVTEHRGRMEAALDDLKTEFGVTTIDEAKEKAARFETALRSAVTKAREALVRAGGQSG